MLGWLAWRRLGQWMVEAADRRLDTRHVWTQIEQTWCRPGTRRRNSNVATVSDTDRDGRRGAVDGDESRGAAGVARAGQPLDRWDGEAVARGGWWWTSRPAPSTTRHTNCSMRT